MSKVGGYIGRILRVGLSTGNLTEQRLPEALLRAFVGGYGLGARILYEQMGPGADALGPENILGFVTGPLTGTPAVMASRYCIVGKSPLTGTWGDANSGGEFGPALKFAGYDAVFFDGLSRDPVYLLVYDGHIVRLPINVIRQVADLAHDAVCGAGVQEPDQRGLGPQVLRKLAQDGAAGIVDVDLIPDLIRVAVLSAEERGLHLALFTIVIHD